MLASVAVYVLVRGELRGQVDAELRDFAGGVFAVRIDSAPAGGRQVAESAVRRRRSVDVEQTLPRQRREADAFSRRCPATRSAAALGYAQVVDSKGRCIGPRRRRTAAAGRRRATVAVARGEAAPFFSDATVDGDPRPRLHAAPVGHGRAVQVARSLSEVDDTLVAADPDPARGLRRRRSGWRSGSACWSRRTALRPVARLTAAAEHVARTRDLAAGSRPAAAATSWRRLARSFNTMLEALERSLGRAAPAGRRRLARAAHAADQPAHQHRGAGRRRAARRRPSASGCSPTSSPSSRS